MRPVPPRATGAARRAAGGARRGAQVGGRRDRRPGDLRGAVEVVEVLPEQVHPAVRHDGGERGARDGHGLERREVVAPQDVVVELEDPLEHHRHDDEPGALVLCSQRQRRLRVELPLEHDRRAQAHREREVREAPGVEERRRDHRPPAGLQRDPLEQRGDRVERLRLPAARALRGPGRARREDQRLALVGRRREVGRVARLRDQVLERAVRALLVRVVPGDEALAPLVGGRQHLGEFVVEDHDRRRLAPRDVGELRSAERGVQEQRVRPELVRRDVGLHPAAVVAAHDRHAVARADALGGERVRQRVGALVHLAERERPRLVDDRAVVGEAGGRRLESRGRRRAPADERARGVEQPVGPLRADDARAREGRHGLHLAGDLAGTRDPHARDYSTVRATEASARRASRPSRSAGGCRRPGAG
jgi:hypothetical protein